MIDGSKTELGITTSETLSKKPTSVLIIGDNPLFLEGTERVIKMGGDFEVQSTTDPTEGLEIIKKAKAANYPIGIVVYDLEVLGPDMAKKAKGLVRHSILRSETIQTPQTMTPRESESTGIDEKLPKNGPIAEFIRHIKTAEEKIKSEDEIRKEKEKKEEIRVLIVEDEKRVSSVLQEALEEKSQIEGVYTSAQQAIAMLEQKKPDDPETDLLIVDLGLADGETAGMRVVEQFRKKYPESSIVFLTGSPDKVDELYTPEQKKNLNFETWPKPLNLAKLKQKIDEIKIAKKIKTETAPEIRNAK